VADSVAKPVCLGLAPSFGFGDRIGLATAGHVEAMRRAGQGIAPIYPQQSIREMTRTGRSPQQVMDDALCGMQEAGCSEPTGADADHLKTPEDVRRTAAAGFCFYTIDPSDHVDERADDYREAELREKFATIAEHARWFGAYCGQSIPLRGGVQIELSEEVCMRAAVKYGRAIEEAIALSACIRQTNESLGQDYEIELSVDETPQPTTLAEHYIIARECLQSGMRLVSLAPRLIGDFEKGIDYKGDLVALEASLAKHAAIAKTLGPYKLSLHSGSDKLSMYAALARATQGCWHVKTAGTSYLEALRVAARHDTALFRRLIDFSRDRYETDRATYHVSATLRDAPGTDEVQNVLELERAYLELWSEVPERVGFTRPGRQILHCTFGSVLTHAALGPALHDLLAAHQDTYTQVLAEHFERHLTALQAGM
jgi:hypothetical protein